MSDTADTIPTTRTPREVFLAFIGAISEGRWTELADFYAEDAVAEIPFSLPAPDRVEGREQLRARFEAATQRPIELRAENIVVYETADPEVVIAEFDYRGRVTTTGRSFVAANIQILRIRDGLIVATRDFHHHLALAAAGGRLPEAAAAFDAAFDETFREGSGIARPGI
ncbi:MAG TPA: nuclear transport factor 2 family protein [Actinocrinis sp.]|jgi:ketosteroid isomerase-like protein